MDSFDFLYKHRIDTVIVSAFFGWLYFKVYCLIYKSENKNALLNKENELNLLKASEIRELNKEINNLNKIINSKDNEINKLQIELSDFQREILLDTLKKNSDAFLQFGVTNLKTRPRR